MSSESTVSTRGLEFLAWLEVNKTRLIVGTAVFAILLASFVIHRWRVAEREQLAGAALIRVQSAVASAPDAREPAGDDYLRVASEHRRTEAGARAKLFAAEAFFRDGRYAESQAQFQAFQEAQPLNPLASTAAFGVAASLDALGKPDEAYQAYQQVVTRHANSAVASQARLAMADLYVAKGEPARALRLYEELQATAWARVAAERREHLLVQHPELSGMDEVFQVPEVTMPVTGEGLELLELTQPAPGAE